jgi:hypothetical protein
MDDADDAVGGVRVEYVGDEALHLSPLPDPPPQGGREEPAHWLPGATAEVLGVDNIELRLNRLITFGVALLERQTAEHGIDEPKARALAALCRAQEIMMRSVRQKNMLREKKNKNDGTDFRDDPVWLAAEFARRIYGVQAPGRGGAGSALRELAGRGTEEVSR